jgi:twinkle protein
MRESFLDHGIEAQGSGQLKARCPQCTPARKAANQNKKDLSVNTDLGAWSCKHCGWEGRLRDDQPYQNKKTEIKREVKKYDKPKYQRGEMPDTVISFFSKRGISRTTLDHCKVGFDKSWRSIAFPYYKNGEVINVKTRTLNKDFGQSKNAEKCVYGYDNINDAVTVITEGEMDTLAIIEAGFPHACSMPDGATSYKFWESVEDRFDSVGKLIIWTDNDQPGYQARLEMAKRIGYERAYYVETPKDCKDANDVLLTHGKDKVLELIANAKEFPIDGIVYAKDVDLVSYWKHGAKEGWTTGIKSIDKFWKFAPEVGELVIGTGYPGSGKSDFFMDILIKQAKQGRKAGIFSPEEFPISRLMKKLMEKYYNLNANDLCQDQVEACWEWLHEHFFFQYLEESIPTIDMICDSIKALAIKKSIRFYLCDPWNELDHSVRGNLSETEWVNQALGKLRRVARQHCVTVIVVAHPTKPRPEDEGKAPSSWAISGSAGFRNKADVVLSVHRPLYGKPEEDGEVDINVTKVKDKDMGGLGYTQLNYNFKSGTYQDPIVRSPND